MRIPVFFLLPLLIILPVVATEEEKKWLSSKECQDLGFTGLALCSDCNTFADYVKSEECSIRKTRKRIPGPKLDIVDNKVSDEMSLMKRMHLPGLRAKDNNSNRLPADATLPRDEEQTVVCGDQDDNWSARGNKEVVDVVEGIFCYLKNLYRRARSPAVASLSLELVSDCRRCCTEESDDSISKVTYSGAILEVCMRKLMFYPDIVAFIEEEKEQFPAMRVQYIYASPPKLIMLDDDGNHKETIRIDNWKREHIRQFLREKVKPTVAS